MAFIRKFALGLALGATAAVAANPALAGCKRMGFTVNDYGKEGPTNDSKELLDKHITKWAAEQGIEKYTVGKKDVNCELFLNLLVVDEHTCTASATVCWGNDKVPASEQEASDTTDKPKKKPKVEAAKADASSDEAPKEAASSDEEKPAKKKSDTAAAEKPAKKSDGEAVKTEAKAEEKAEKAEKTAKTEEPAEKAEKAEKKQSEGSETKKPETAKSEAPADKKEKTAATEDAAKEHKSEEHKSEEHKAEEHKTEKKVETGTLPPAQPSKADTAAATAAEAAASAAERAAAAAERAAAAAERAAAAVAAASSAKQEDKLESKAPDATVPPASTEKP